MSYGSIPIESVLLLQVPDQTIYQLNFVVRGQHLAMAAAAKTGKVFIAGASTDESKWLSDGKLLQAAVQTFSLSY